MVVAVVTGYDALLVALNVAMLGGVCDVAVNETCDEVGEGSIFAPLAGYDIVIVLAFVVVLKVPDDKVIVEPLVNCVIDKVPEKTLTEEAVILIVANFVPE